LTRVRLLHALAVGVLALVVVSRGYANPADAYGIGSRGIALGGALSGDVADASAVYYNPSGLVFAERLVLQVGVQSVRPDLELDGARSAAREFSARVVGFAAPGTILGVPVAFGLLAQLSGDRLARIDTFSEDEQRWVRHQDQPEQVFVGAAASLRPTEWLTFGAGVTFLASTEATLSLSGVATQPGFSGQDEYDSRLEHEVVAELQSERAPLFGVTLLPLDAWRFAAVYRGESRIALAVNSELDGEVALGPLPFPAHYELESTTIQSFVPRQVVLGASYRGFERASLNVDLQWTQWSRYRSPLSATRSELMLDTLGLLTVPELPEPTSLVSARLEDRVAPRVGGEYRLELSRAWELPLRAGYVYEATPLGRGSSPNLVDANRHVASLGVGARGPGPSPLLGDLRFDVHVSGSFFVPRSVVGPDGTTHRARGRILVLGATLGVDL
jgi:long-subunit fatty acid transport protein